MLQANGDTGGQNTMDARERAIEDLDNAWAELEEAYNALPQLDRDAVFSLQADQVTRYLLRRMKLQLGMLDGAESSTPDNETPASRW